MPSGPPPVPRTKLSSRSFVTTPPGAHAPGGNGLRQGFDAPKLNVDAASDFGKLRARLVALQRFPQSHCISF